MKKKISKEAAEHTRLNGLGSQVFNHRTFNRRFAIKKLILTAAMVLGTVGVGFAQSTASQNVTINASVIQALTLSVNNSTLDLGQMVAGTTPAVISPSSSTIQFHLQGNGGSTVGISYSSPTLTGSNGGTMTFSVQLAGDSVSTNQGTAASVSSGSSVTLTGSNFTQQNYYFWLGGSVGAVASDQTPGDYTGTFTLTVTYQ